MVRLIKGFLRLSIRLGLIAGIGFALFKLVKGRRSEYGSPSADWAPAPAPNPNLPKPVPDPPLVNPVELHEVIEKKAAEKAVLAETEPAPPGASVVKKAAPAVKKAAAKKTAEPAAGPVKKVAAKKAAPEKAAAAKKAPAKAADAPKKAAPVKKAPKKAP